MWPVAQPSTAFEPTRWRTFRVFRMLRERRCTRSRADRCMPRTARFGAAGPRDVMAQGISPLRLRFEDGELTISAQTQDVGESRETLPVAFTGEPFEIGFNAEFLRDGVESAASDELVLTLINPLRPGLIEGADGDFWYLIMP